MNKLWKAKYLFLFALISGCGGGGGGGSSLSDGQLVLKSGNVSYLQSPPPGASYSVKLNHAYSIDLEPLNGTDPDLMIYDAPPSGSSVGNLIDYSWNTGGAHEILSYIAPSADTHYAAVITFDNSASYKLRVYDNHLATDGTTRTRSTLNDTLYFSFDAVAGQAYDVTVTPTSGDPSLSVYAGVTTSFIGTGLYPDSTTKIGTANNATGAAPESLIFVASQTKTYYFAVSNVNTATQLSFDAKVSETTAAADLQVSISSLSYSSGNLTVGYSVANTGVAYSSNVNLGFWLNSTTAPVQGTVGDATAALVGVAPGASITGSKTISTGGLTTGTLWLYVDPENALTEANESNNTAGPRSWSAPVTAPQSFNFESGSVPSAIVGSGNSSWGIDVGGAASSAYSLRSGSVAVNQTSCAEVAVTGAVSVSFDWKALTDYSTDSLKFYIDGSVYNTYSGAGSWVTATNSVTSTLHTYKWCYVKGATDNAAVDDAGWIDNIVFLPEQPDLTVSLNSVTSDGSNLTIGYTVLNNSTAASAATTLNLWANLASAPTVGSTGDVQVSVPAIAGGGSVSNTAIVPSTATSGTSYAIVDTQNTVAEKNETNNVSVGKAWVYYGVPLASYDFETGTIPAGFVASGNAGWQVDSTTASSGTYSIRAQPILDSQTACVATTVASSSAITFDWKVSSEATYDFLRFYIDGVLQTGSISGTVAWSGKTFSGLAVGSHEYKWCYTKDNIVSSGTDTGWVDNIKIY